MKFLFILIVTNLIFITSFLQRNKLNTNMNNFYIKQNFIRKLESNYGNRKSPISIISIAPKKNILPLRKIDELPISETNELPISEINELPTTIPETIMPNTSLTNPNMLALNTKSNPFLIGFDGFSNTSEKIYFNSYLKFEEDWNNKISNNLSFLLDINYYNRLRILEEQTASCNNASKVSYKDIIKYECNSKISSNKFSSIKFKEGSSKLGIFEINLTPTSLAKLENIKNEIGYKISANPDDYEFLKNTEIISQSPSNFVLKGDKIKSEFESNNIKLVISQNNNIPRNITCKGYNKVNEKNNISYFLECENNNIFDFNLNNAFVYYDNSPKKLIVMFRDGNSFSSIKNFNQNKYFKNMSKKRKGLSNGGIIAIVIPSIIVLIGILGIIFTLRKNKIPSPLEQEVPNNTIGVSSSENVVNK